MTCITSIRFSSNDPIRQCSSAGRILYIFHVQKIFFYKGTDDFLRALLTKLFNLTWIFFSFCASCDLLFLFQDSPNICCCFFHILVLVQDFSLFFFFFFFHFLLLVRDFLHISFFYILFLAHDFPHICFFHIFFLFQHFAGISFFMFFFFFGLGFSWYSFFDTAFMTLDLYNISL